MVLHNHMDKEQHVYQFWRQVLRRAPAKPLMPSLGFVVIRPLLILVIKGDYAPDLSLSFAPILEPNSKTRAQPVKDQLSADPQ